MELNEEDLDLITSNPAMSEETKKALNKFKVAEQENKNDDELSMEQLDHVFGGIPYMDDPEEQNDRVM